MKKKLFACAMGIATIGCAQAMEGIPNQEEFPKELCPTNQTNPAIIWGPDRFIVQDSNRIFLFNAQGKLQGTEPITNEDSLCFAEGGKFLFYTDEKGEHTFVLPTFARRITPSKKIQKYKSSETKLEFNDYADKFEPFPDNEKVIYFCKDKCITRKENPSVKRGEPYNKYTICFYSFPDILEEPEE